MASISATPGVPPRPVWPSGVGVTAAVPGAQAARPRAVPPKPASFKKSRREIRRSFRFIVPPSFRATPFRNREFIPSFNTCAWGRRYEAVQSKDLAVRARALAQGAVLCGQPSQVGLAHLSHHQGLQTAPETMCRADAVTRAFTWSH